MGCVPVTVSDVGGILPLRAAVRNRRLQAASLLVVLAALAACAVPSDSAGPSPASPVLVSPSVSLSPAGALPEPAAGAPGLAAYVSPRGDYVPEDVPLQKVCAKRAPSSAEEFDRLLDRLRGPGWSGGDVGVSVPLGSGRTLWFFGDSFVAWAKERPDARYSSPPRMVRNTALLQKGRCLLETPGSLPNSLQLIPDDGRSWFWPTAGVAVGKKVFVFVQRMVSTDANSWEFDLAGMDVAVFSVSREGFPLFERVVGTPGSRLSSSAGAAAWGAAVVADGPWLYVYGSQRPREDLVFGHEVYVARVRSSQVADASRWRFWDGSGWGAAQSAAVSLLDAAGGPENVFSVLPVAGSSAVALVSKSDGFLGPSVSLWVAQDKTSPFAPVELHLHQARSKPDTGSGDELLYMGLAHSGFSKLSGPRWRLGVSVSRNSTNLRKLSSSPLFYRPQFADVTVASPLP